MKHRQSRALLQPRRDLPTVGGTIVITGSGFGPGGTQAASVSVGGATCAVNLASYTSNSITCTLPAGAGANLAVVITVQGISNPVSYTYSFTQPAISNINYNGAATAGGTSVVIQGTNFGASVGSVSVNGTAVCTVANPSQWTDSQITCTMPISAGVVGVSDETTDLKPYLMRGDEAVREILMAIIRKKPLRHSGCGIDRVACERVGSDVGHRWVDEITAGDSQMRKLF